MFKAVLAAKAQLHRFPSGSLDGAERRLARLSRQPRPGRLFIAVPAVSAYGSMVADLAELSALSRAYGALLIADVSHDFGAMGQDGGGVMELQGCLGRIDIVLGSLGKAFAIPAGFAAFRHPTHAAKLSGHCLSPETTSRLLAATDIAFGPEGRQLRRNLHGVTLRLRNHLMADGARAMGSASPLVPVLLPPDTALARAALLSTAGPKVTLLSSPRVPHHAPRWRIELNALHTPGDIDDLAEVIRDVTRAFDRVSSRVQPAAWPLTDAVT
jgi:7-keto-8-aminopelargonate synthetase-like enzyme